MSKPLQGLRVLDLTLADAVLKLARDFVDHPDACSSDGVSG